MFSPLNYRGIYHFDPNGFLVLAGELRVERIANSFGGYLKSLSI